MESSSIWLPPSLRLRHLWPEADQAAAIQSHPPPAPTNPEWARCAADPAYFIHTYCQIYDASVQAWVPFALWPAQVTTLATVDGAVRTVILKARQLGLSWLLLCYALHGLIFRPTYTALIFSKREEEAKYLLGAERLQGVYTRLPAWLRATATPIRPGTTAWMLSNGSVAHAFPANGGDGRTASLAFVDEFDLLDNKEQSALLTAVKPTVDGGGKLVLLSKVNKRQPQSEFKRIYRGAVAGVNGWTPVFLPWDVRPSRDAAWYADVAQEIQQRTGATDELWENYPASDAEALADLALDKRLPPAWVLACYDECAPLPEVVLPPGAPHIPGLEVYRLPQPGRAYVLGVDPATGATVRGDASALTVGDAATGEEVAALSGSYEPAVFAALTAQIARWYNAAPVLIERNNRAFGMFDWLADHAPDVVLLLGLDGQPGWVSSSVGKVRLYDTVADALRSHDAVIHSPATKDELASIERATLRAPEGQPDDRSDGYALMQAGRTAPAPEAPTLQWGKYTIGR